MPGSRIIRLHQDEIALTDTTILPLQATSIPAGAIRFAGEKGEPVFWEVEARYNINKQTVTLRVTDYTPSKYRAAFFYKQEPKGTVKRIEFEPLDELSLIRCSRHCDLSALHPHVVESTAAPHVAARKFAELQGVAATVPRITRDRGQEMSNNPAMLGRPSHPYQPPPPKTWYANFRYRFDVATFETGALAGEFEKTPYGQRPLRFRILNETLRPEFVYIRDFLTAALGRKTFDVQLKVTEYFEWGREREIVATSEQVAAINSTLIEALRMDRVRRVSRLEPGDGRQTLTLTEVSDLLRGPDEPAIALLTDGELLDHLIASSGSARNQAQLQYLASEKQQAGTPLRITVGGAVGFIFTIGGATQRHFCWELLNSNATYLWSFPAQLSLQEAIEALDRQLAVIQVEGRARYRKQRADGFSELSFAFIEHTLQGRTAADTFAQWRTELHERLR